MKMSDEETYLRAKLTEINNSIERLTEMLNRMIEVLNRITEVEDTTSEVSLAVAANGEKIDELLQIVQSLSKKGVAVAEGPDISERGAVSSLQAIIENLEPQLREGAIASDLAVKINDAAELLEDRMGGGGPLIIKMKRWVRILRTYGRVDAISPSDMKKLQNDMKEWITELGASR
jgi:hypothetical protein